MGLAASVEAMAFAMRFFRTRTKPKTALICKLILILVVRLLSLRFSLLEVRSCQSWVWNLLINSIRNA